MISTVTQENKLHREGLRRYKETIAILLDDIKDPTETEKKMSKLVFAYIDNGEVAWMIENLKNGKCNSKYLVRNRSRFKNMNLRVKIGN